MAFSLSGFQQISEVGNPNLPKVGAYYSATDTLATIIANNYFDTLADRKYVSIGDQILIKGSDDSGSYKVTAISPHVTITISGGTAPTLLQYATIPFTAANFAGMYAAPITIFAAPTAQEIILINSGWLEKAFDDTQWTGGGTIGLQYGETAALGDLGASAGLSSTVIGDTNAGFYPVQNIRDSDAYLKTGDVMGKKITLSNNTAAFTGGTSDFILHLWYQIIPITYVNP